MKHYTPSYHTLNKPMNKKILKTTDNLIDDFFDRHSKLFGMRQDVHLPEGSDQSLIMKVNHRFIESQRNKGYDPAYIMVREISDEGKTHYHMALLLNGQKVQSTYYVFKDMERILNNVAGPGGSINHCDNRGRNADISQMDSSARANTPPSEREYLPTCRLHVSR